VKLAVISQFRFLPALQRVSAALSAGQLGRPILGEAIVKWYRTQGYYDSAGWRGTWELDGGGALMNQGIHFVDLLQWLLGPVDSVVAHCATAAHDVAVEDVSVALLTFASGALGIVNVSTAIFPGFAERIEITGTGGTAIVEAGQIAVWQLKAERGESGPFGRDLPRSYRDQEAAQPGLPFAQQLTGHRAQLVDLLDAIASGREPAVNGEEARKPLAIVQAIYAAARSGNRVTLESVG
jgi:UDP-N-acetyl-2-amino-2-deoxyglucuronate dehydrogenase